MKKDRIFILLAIASLVIASVQVLERYVKLPDIVAGMLQGIGIGLLILVLLKARKLSVGRE